MLQTIQIVALLQGAFLIFILQKKRENYNPPNYWLLLGSIISVILYTLGDDDYNLFADNTDWFFFHECLVITFLFLFVKYYQTGKQEFSKKDYLFFIPYILTVGVEIFESVMNLKGNLSYEIIEFAVESIFIGYISIAIYDIIRNNKDKWLLFFLIPLGLIFLLDKIISMIDVKNNGAPSIFESYGLILLFTFLFYYVVYKLLESPKEILPKLKCAKYKTSNLKKEDIEKHKNRLIKLMSDDKMFLNKTLSVIEVAKKLNIPRQHVSEILNIHMQVNFQDFINSYRIEKFIEYLQKDEYKNYTILAIALEVGFSSKTSFNTTFKKVKGITPTQFKKKFILM